MTATTQNDPFAESILEGVLAFDQPIGQLIEIALAMSEGPESAAIRRCSSELLRHQFGMVERITTAYPRLDKIVESRSPAFSEDAWRRVGGTRA